MSVVLTNRSGLAAYAANFGCIDAISPPTSRNATELAVKIAKKRDLLEVSLALTKIRNPVTTPSIVMVPIPPTANSGTTSAPAIVITWLLW